MIIIPIRSTITHKWSRWPILFHINRNIKRLLYCQYGLYSLTFRALALCQRETETVLSDEGPTLKTLDYTVSIRIGSTQTKYKNISICISALPTQHTTFFYHGLKLLSHFNQSLLWDFHCNAVLRGNPIRDFKALSRDWHNLSHSNSIVFQ